MGKGHIFNTVRVIETERRMENDDVIGKITAPDGVEIIK